MRILSASKVIKGCEIAPFPVLKLAFSCPFSFLLQIASKWVHACCAPPLLAWRNLKSYSPESNAFRCLATAVANDNMNPSGIF
jgi:hypothetical protein